MTNPRRTRADAHLEHLSPLQRAIALVSGILFVAPFYLVIVSRCHMPSHWSTDQDLFLSPAPPVLCCRSYRQSFGSQRKAEGPHRKTAKGGETTCQIWEEISD